MKKVTHIEEEIKFDTDTIKILGSILLAGITFICTKDPIKSMTFLKH